MILVDYSCPACGKQQRWTPSPPPAELECADCGAPARRLWAPVGLGRVSRTAPSAAESVRRPRRPAVPACQRWPQLPGICHMSDSAARMWVAKYRRDHRAVDAELARQESVAAQRPPTIADAITHQHYPQADAPHGATP